MIDLEEPKYKSFQPSRRTRKLVACCHIWFFAHGILDKPYSHAFEDTQQFPEEQDVS